MRNVTTLQSGSRLGEVEEQQKRHAPVAGHKHSIRDEREAQSSTCKPSVLLSSSSSRCNNWKSAQHRGLHFLPIGSRQICSVLLSALLASVNRTLPPEHSGTLFMNA
jgi:hypothetical protein